MTPDAPRIVARNGGVLKIPASATQHRPGTTAMPSTTGAPSGPRLKLVIRRLPPGLTETEFETLLGGEWKVGSGRVDWAIYKPGKVSKEYHLAAYTTDTMSLQLLVQQNPRSRREHI